MVGGVSPIDVHDPEVQAAAQFVVQSANTNGCNGLCSGIAKTGNLTLVSITSANSQVVAGALYRLELVLADTKGAQVYTGYA